MSLTRVLALCAAAALCGCPTSATDDDDDSVSSCTAAERPTLSIGSPGNGEVFESADTITFALTLTDPDGDTDDLTVAVQDNSDSQGVDLGIAVPAPNEQGLTTFTMDADRLDTGLNTVRILVTDDDNCSTNDQVLVCVDYDVSPCQP